MTILTLRGHYSKISNYFQLSNMCFFIKIEESTDINLCGIDKILQTRGEWKGKKENNLAYSNQGKEDN